MTGQANTLPVLLNCCLLESCKQQGSDPLPLKIRMNRQTLDGNEATFWRISTHLAKEIVCQIRTLNSWTDNIACKLTCSSASKKVSGISSIRSLRISALTASAAGKFNCSTARIASQSLNSARLIRIGASIQAPPTERC